MQMRFVTANVAEIWRRFGNKNSCLLEAQYVHDTFVYDIDEDKDDCELVLTTFRTNCEPRKNII